MRDLIDAHTLPLTTYSSLKDWEEGGLEITSTSGWDNFIGFIAGQFFEAVPDISLCFDIQRENSAETNKDMNESQSGVHAEYNAKLTLSCWDDSRDLRITLVDVQKNKAYYDSLKRLYTNSDGRVSGALNQRLAQHASLQPNEQRKIMALADNFFEFTPDMYTYDIDDDGHKDTPVGLIYEGTDPKYIILWEEAN